MAHKLISFLGKGRKEDGGYRRTHYNFEGSSRSYHTPFFGLALLQELSHDTPVDHFILLGTAASIWDALLEDELGLTELWLTLSDRVKAGAVDDALLLEVSPIIEANFIRRNLAKKVSLRIIPMGRNLTEQVDMLQLMAQFAEPGDSFSLDVTHGFRSLPMLGLTCAMLLQQLKNVEVTGLYYGALEMAGPDNKTPVVELSGLLRIAQWLGALSAFSSSGDYGLFSHLLADDKIADSLARAGFLEKTMQISQARSHLKSGRKGFDELAKQDPIFSLFQEKLTQLTNWSDEPTYARRQLAAAENARQHRDYVRAAALAMEAMISNTVGKGSDPADYQARKEAKDTLNNTNRKGGRHASPDGAAYQELNDLRNALAHGTSPVHNTFGQQSTLQDPEKLERRLDELIALLKGKLA